MNSIPRSLEGALTRARSILVVFALLTTGCGGLDDATAETDDRTATFGDFGRGSSDADSTGAVASLGDMDFLEQAVEERIRTCMAAHDLRYATIGEIRDPLVQLGPLAPETLRAEGYDSVLYDKPLEGSLRGDVADDEPNENALILAGMSEAERRRWYDTLYGSDDDPKVRFVGPDGVDSWTSADSCYATATTEVFGSVEKHTNFESGGMVVRMRTERLLHEDAEFLGAYRRWIGCLAGRGWSVPELEAASFDMSRPYAAALVWDMYEQQPLEQAEREQLRLASDDADCQESTGLQTVSAEVSVQALEDVAGELGYDMLGRQELIADSVARARTLLGAG